MIKKIKSLRERRAKKRIIKHMVKHTKKHHRVHRGHLKELKKLSRDLKRVELKHKVIHTAKKPVVKGYGLAKRPVAHIANKVLESVERHKKHVSKRKKQIREAHKRFKERKYMPPERKVMGKF